MLVPTAASREECRDAHCASAFAKQTIARQGDLPALRRYGTWDLPAAHDGNVLRPSCVEENATLDLPAANCIRSECRTSNARPYAASREECRDEHRSSAFAKQTIARQGDLPALQQSGTLDLPAANCIRSECRTSDARPYAASREECRDEHCASAFAKQTIARQGDLPCVYPIRYVRFACGKLHSFRMPDERCSSLRSVTGRM